MKGNQNCITWLTNAFFFFHFLAIKVDNVGFIFSRIGASRECRMNKKLSRSVSNIKQMLEYQPTISALDTGDQVGRDVRIINQQFTITHQSNQLNSSTYIPVFKLQLELILFFVQVLFFLELQLLELLIHVCGRILYSIFHDKWRYSTCTPFLPSKNMSFSFYIITSTRV